MSGRRITAKAAYRAPRVSERAAQAHIVQLLRSVGGQVYVMGTTRRRGDHPGTMQTPGIPDVMAFLPVKRAREAHAAAIAPTCRQCGHAMNGQGGMCTALDGACRCVCVSDPTRVFLFVEVKAAGGRLREEQRAFRAECQDAAIAHVVGGLDAVIAWLIERRYLAPESVPHYRQPAPEARV